MRGINLYLRNKKVNTQPVDTVPTGLTSNDREQYEQEEISNYYDTDESTEDNQYNQNNNEYLFPQPSRRNTILGALAEAKARHDNFNEVRTAAYEEYKKKFEVGDNIKNEATNTIKEVADQVSPYYHAYKYTDDIKFTTDEWNDLAAQYAALLNTSGEESANSYLDSRIRQNVAENLGYLKKLGKGGGEFLTQLGGGIIQFVGMIHGLATSIPAAIMNDNEDLAFHQKLFDNVIDNPITRYGNDVIKYGTYFTESDDMQKKAFREAGLNMNEIVQTDENRKRLLTWDTPFELMGQAGVMTSFVLGSKGLSGGSRLIFKGGSKLIGKQAAKTGASLAKTQKALEFLNKFSNFNDKVVLPGVVGTAEGVMEGLNTKIETQDNLTEIVLNDHRNKVAERANEIINKYAENRIAEGNTKMYDAEGNPVSEEKWNEMIYNQVWEEMLPELEESMRQVDYLSTRAGLKNLSWNSAINGMMNATLKAGWFNSSTRNKLLNTRLGKMLKPKAEFTISQNANGVIDVVPQMSKAQYAKSIAKEMLGEGLEEGLQNISDAYSQSWADYNMHQYILNKYNPDNYSTVGQTYAMAYAAAAKSALNEITSFETQKSSLYGALGTMLMLDAPRRGRNADGSKTWGRAVDKNGNFIESKWDVAKRVLPFRSGITAGIDEVKKEFDKRKSDAESLREWLNNPNNKYKMEGISASLTWMEDMENAAFDKDEYDYRNSKLGKQINDMIMLNKLKDTDFYKAQISQLLELKNLEEGSETAQKYIDAVRNSNNDDLSSLSDSDIIARLKKNASKLLEVNEKVESEGEKIQRTLGDIEDDTKQALIFNRISVDDWKKRVKTMDEELKGINIENSTENSGTPKEIANLIAQYGSIEKAFEAREKAKKAVNDAESMLNDIKRDVKAYKGKVDKKTLKGYKVQAKELSEITKKSNAEVLRQTAVLEGKDKDDLKQRYNKPLNESEIMTLDAISRYAFLLRAKNQLIDNIVYDENATEEKKKKIKESVDKRKEEVKVSEQQQQVIDNLEKQLTSNNPEILDKIKDLSRIQAAMDRFTKQYTEVLSDQRGFNDFVRMTKMYAAKDLARKRVDKLKKIDNYNDFVNEWDDFLENEDATVINEARKLLKGNEFFELLEKNKEFRINIGNQAGFDKEYKESSKNDQMLFNEALNFLDEQHVDLNDADAVFNALYNTTNGYNDFSVYLERKNTSRNPVMLGQDGIEKILATYNRLRTKVNNYKRTQELINQKAEANPEIVEENKPVTEITPGPNPNPEKPAENIPEPPVSTVKNPVEQQPKAGNEDNAVVASINISEELKNNPDSPISRYIDKYSILEYIYDNWEQIGESDIFFITSKELYDEMSKNPDFNKDNGFPVVTAVKDINGPVEINGVRYQPIGILPNTGASNYSGSNRLDSIRRYAENNGVHDSVIQKDGKPLTTTANGKSNCVKAHYKESNNTGEYDIMTVIENSMKHSESKELQGISNNEKRNSPAYKRIKERIKKGLAQFERNGKKILVFKQSKLKKDNEKGDTHPIFIMHRPLSVTTQKNGNKTFVEVMNEFNNDSTNVSSIDNVINFNGTINNLFKSIKNSFESIAKSIGKEGYESEVSDSFIDYVENYGNILLNKIRNYLYLGNEGNVEIEIKADREALNSPDNPKAVFNVTLKHYDSAEKDNLIGEYPLCVFTPSDFNGTSEITEKKIIADLIYNSTMDSSSNELRKDNNGEEFANWQITYNKVRNIREAEEIKKAIDNEQDAERKEMAIKAYNERAKNDELDSKAVDNWFDDNIIYATHDTINYEVEYVKINAPKAGGIKTNPQADTNPNTSMNGNLSGSKNGSTEVKTPDGSIIDPNTGSTINGKEDSLKSEKSAFLKQTEEQLKRRKSMKERFNELAKEIKDKINEIKERSKQLHLNNDGSAYTDDSANIVSSRVTHIIEADKSNIENGSPNRFDENSPYYTVSTEIGNSVDDLIRDFFSDELKEWDNYPGINKESFEAFLKSLEELSNYFDAKGMCVIPKDIKAFGKIVVKDSKGNTYTEDVAGTLDLLVVDKNGNYHIYDIKTKHNCKDSKSIDDKTVRKWRRQTSMYAELMEQTYDIKISSINILPVGVKYPSPKKKSDYTFEKNGDKKVLYNNMNGTKTVFTNANPKRLEMLENLERIPLNIVYDHLRDDEKTIAQNITELLESNPNGEQTNNAPVSAEIPNDNSDNLDSFMDDVIFGETGMDVSDVVIKPTETRAIPNDMTWDSLTEGKKSLIESVLGGRETYERLIKTSEALEDKIRHCIF